MAKHPEANGQSDIGLQNLFFTLSINLRPRRVLEIGTHIGTGAVIVGQALKSNGYGKLISLEPTQHYRDIANSFIKKAAVGDFVEVLPYFSYEETCKERLRLEGNFELIFVDGAHDYKAAAHDFRLAAELICDNGLILCHDVGAISHKLDPSGKGGARQALLDFCREFPEYRALFLEFPVWLNPTGTAILVREKLAPDPAEEGTLV